MNLCQIASFKETYGKESMEYEQNPGFLKTFIMWSSVVFLNLVQKMFLFPHLMKLIQHCLLKEEYKFVLCLCWLGFIEDWCWIMLNNFFPPE